MVILMRNILPNCQLQRNLNSTLEQPWLKEYYPCNEKGPLCPILDDHNFLAEVFASDKRAWRGIKKYCKDKFAGRLSFSLTRDEIGPLLKEIFSDAGLRGTYEAACYTGAHN